MKRRLNLERPLAVLDLETTGTFPDEDRIVEIGILKIYPSGKTSKYHAQVNPGVPIPAEATEIHSITNNDVKRKPKFRKIAPQVQRFLKGCDLAGFNALRFDIPFLRNEFQRANVPFSLDGARTVDVLRIFHLKEPRDLKAAYLFYCHKKHTKAHSALDDARVSWQVLQAQLERYPDLSPDLDDLHNLSAENDRYVDLQGRKFEWRNGQAAFAFGNKHRGRFLKDVAENDAEYLEWMLGTDFPPDTKKIITDALDGKFPSRL